MIIAEVEVADHKLTIDQDITMESPRAFDNLGVMVTGHWEYDFGDREAKNLEDYSNWHDWFHGEIIEEEVDSIEDIIYKPLYLMDHSQLYMTTSSQRFRAVDHAGWDWGQVGYIYTTAERIKEIYRVEEINNETIERAEEALKQEVKQFDYYLRGEIYSFRIDRLIKCSECNQIVEKDHIDSCGGFFGAEGTYEDMRYHVEEKYHYLFDELEKQEFGDVA